MKIVCQRGIVEWIPPCFHSSLRVSSDSSVIRGSNAVFEILGRICESSRTALLGRSFEGTVSLEVSPLGWQTSCQDDRQFGLFVVLSGHASDVKKVGRLAVSLLRHMVSQE